MIGVLEAHLFPNGFHLADHTGTTIQGEGRHPLVCASYQDGRGWFRTSDLSRVKRALSH